MGDFFYASTGEISVFVKASIIKKLHWRSSSTNSITAVTTLGVPAGIKKVRLKKLHWRSSSTNSITAVTTLGVPAGIKKVRCS